MHFRCVLEPTLLRAAATLKLILIYYIQQVVESNILGCLGIVHDIRRSLWAKVRSPNVRVTWKSVRILHVFYHSFVIDIGKPKQKISLTTLSQNKSSV